MSYVSECYYCRKIFSDDELYMSHLITDHMDKVRDYMTKNWSGETKCQGGCGAVFKAEDLTPETKCYNRKHKKPYPVGKVAFRLAARFTAARDADRLKQRPLRDH